METLAALVQRDGPLNEHDAVGWAIRLAKRVEELHKLGVAHGGISAECVLAGSRERHARGVLADVRQTAAQPAYHSPERHAGRGISPADDTWAIAVTLYHLVTGSLPFGDDSPEEIRRRLAAAAPSPLAVFDVGDDELQRVLDTFLARNISQRVVRAASLREALERWHPDPAVRALSPLEEAHEEDSFGDDEDEENVATVMRDFSDVRAQLAAYMPAPADGRAAPGAFPLGASQPQAPAPPQAALPRPGESALAAPKPRAQHPTHVGGFRVGDVIAAARAQAEAPPTPRGGFAPSPPPRQIPGLIAGAAPAPRPPPARPVAPQPAARPVVPVGLGGGTQPDFDIPTQDDDENGSTMLIGADQTDLSAAIEEALAQRGAARPVAAPGPPGAGVGHGPPPGWPAQGLMAQAPMGQPHASAAAPFAPAPLAAQPMPFAPPQAPNAAPVEALIGGRPLAAPASPPLVIPPEEPSRLRGWLIVAVVVLLLVVAAVALLFLRQQGIITVF